jgi:hypothetical protein
LARPDRGGSLTQADHATVTTRNRKKLQIKTKISIGRY